MNAAYVTESLTILKLTPKEAAQLLSLDVKSVNRYLLGTVQVPGPVTETLRAWRRLEAMKLPWRPNERSLSFLSEEEIAEQFRLHREETLQLDQIIQRVRDRGGPAMPWKVDLEEGEASLADVMYVHFYKLDNGGFSPSTYRMADREPYFQRDLPMIEDAIASIAAAISDSRKARPAV